jgi:RNA polymerase sigma-70 factor (ECF subfamily)
MSADAAFADLMARLQAGDEAAAAEVFHRFAERLIALARSRLDHLLRTKVDPEDVMQSVYRSFFRRQHQAGYEFTGWDGLWGLLTIITLRKCGHCAEYFHAGRRDIRREASPRTPDYAADLNSSALARDPTPSHAARLAETVEQVMRELGSRERDIVALSLQGLDTVQISAEVGRTERTVQRVLKRVREQLQQMRHSLN